MAPLLILCTNHPQVHVLSRGIANLGLALLKYFSLGTVDSLLVLLSKLVYGDMSKYGLRRPSEGPLLMKTKYGKYPFIDLGTCQKIKSGEIQVTRFDLHLSSS